MSFKKFKPEWEGSNAPLWNNQYPDWETLVSNHTPYTAYVGIDFEGYTPPKEKRGENHHKLYDVSEMGIAIIPPPVLQKRQPVESSQPLYGDKSDTKSNGPGYNPAAFPVPSLDLKTLLQDTAIESYTFRLHERGPLAQEKEKTALFKTAYFDENELDGKLESFLASVHERFNTEYAEMAETEAPGCVTVESPIRLVLVAYSIAMECQILCSALPLSLYSGHLYAVCDLAGLTKRAIGHTNTLMCILKSLGYPYGPLVKRSLNKTHRAGNDAIRTLVVLLHILHFTQATGIIPPRMKIQTRGLYFDHNGKPIRCEETTCGGNCIIGPMTSSSNEKGHLHPFQHGMRRTSDHATSETRTSRPEPYEDFPFTARIRTKRSKPLTLVIGGYGTAHDMFGTYNPVSIVYKGNYKAAWICFSDQETLDRFVLEIHNKEHIGVVWDAKALSPLDVKPPRPPTKAEKMELKRALREQTRGAIQAERQAFRETIRLYDTSDSDSTSDGCEGEGFSFGIGMVGIESEW